MAIYDLNEIADALADVWQGLDADTFDSTLDKVTSYAEAKGVANVPAIIVELDDVTWDLTMARGSDRLQWLAYLLVAKADAPSGQRLIRKMLSTGGLAERVKDALEADNELGGLVSFAVATGTRSIGNINYAGVDYLGAVIEIEMVAQ